jgi:hypothetical protein
LAALIAYTHQTKRPALKFDTPELALMIPS